MAPCRLLVLLHHPLWKDLLPALAEASQVLLSLHTLLLIVALQTG